MNLDVEPSKNVVSIVSSLQQNSQKTQPALEFWLWTSVLTMKCSPTKSRTSRGNFPILSRGPAF